MERVEFLVRPYQNSCRIELVTDGVTRIFEKSTTVVAASGTVTLETAIFGIPMVIIYRISPVSYMLGQALVDVDHIGLVNIIADERIVPELIQKDASPAKIAAHVGDLIQHPQKMIQIKEKLRNVKHLLGSAGAAEKTADIALSMLSPNSHL